MLEYDSKRVIFYFNTTQMVLDCADTVKYLNCNCHVINCKVSIICFNYFLVLFHNPIVYNCISLMKLFCIDDSDWMTTTIIFSTSTQQRTSFCQISLQYEVYYCDFMVICWIQIFVGTGEPLIKCSTNCKFSIGLYSEFGKTTKI